MADFHADAPERGDRGVCGIFRRGADNRLLRVRGQISGRILDRVVINESHEIVPQQLSRNVTRNYLAAFWEKSPLYPESDLDCNRDRHGAVRQPTFFGKARPR